MNLFVYTRKENNVSNRLINEILGLTKVKGIEILHNVESLKNRILFKLGKKPAIGVLCITTVPELNVILSFRELLEDIKLILILPDRNNHTISEGHKLHPRFVSYVDGDFSDVGAVLNKMIANIRAAGRTPCQPTDRVRIKELNRLNDQIKAPKLDSIQKAPRAP